MVLATVAPKGPTVFDNGAPKGPLGPTVWVLWVLGSFWLDTSCFKTCTLRVYAILDYTSHVETLMECGISTIGPLGFMQKA